MSRVDIIELYPIRTLPLTTRYKGKKVDTPIQRDGFKIIEGPLIAKITLDRANVIYTDDFASCVSAYLQSGKNVEIDCGVENKGTIFIVQELVFGDVLEKVKRQDRLEIKTQTHTERIRKGLWDLFGKKHIFATYSKDSKPKVDDPEASPLDFHNTLPNNNSSLLQFDGGFEESQSDQKIVEEEADQFFANYSKYAGAPRLEIDYPFNDFYQQMEDLIHEHGIVEIKRRDLQGNAEFFGLFVKRDKNSNETIINLNSQDEVYFEEIFAPLVRYFVQKGETVLVDHIALDPCELENKIFESPVYNSIQESTGAKIEVEEREVDPDTYETKTYVVLQP